MDPTRPLVCAEQSSDFETLGFDITGDCAATLLTILASSGWNKTTYIHPRRKDRQNNEVKWVSYFEWILRFRGLIDKLLEVAKTTWWKMCELHKRSPWRNNGDDWDDHSARSLSQVKDRVISGGHRWPKLGWSRMLHCSISCMESKAGNFQECLRTDTNLHLVQEKCW